MYRNTPSAVAILNCASRARSECSSGVRPSSFSATVYKGAGPSKTSLRPSLIYVHGGLLFKIASRTLAKYKCSSLLIGLSIREISRASYWRKARGSLTMCAELFPS